MKNKYAPNKILYYILKELPTVILTIVFGLGYNIIFVFVPSFQGKLLDAVIELKPIKTILLSALFFLLIVLFVQVSRYFKRFFVRRFANKTTRTMRLIMYENTINQSIASLDKFQVGDLMTRCVGDVDITVEGIRKSITELLDTGVAAVAYLVMLFFYTSKITIISCGFIFIAITLALIIKTSIYKFNKEYRSSCSALTAKAYELTANSTLFKSYGVTRLQAQKFNDTCQTVKNKAIKASLLENSMPPIYQVVASIGVVFVLFFGGKNVLSGVWTVGVFTAYLSLFLAFTIKASKISKLFNSVQKAKISWTRTKKYFNSDDSCPKTENILLNNSLDLQVKNLTFFYGDTQIFKPISFDAKSGDIIAITGKVASGKTTALVALSALYGYCGSVILNGVELKNCDKKAISQVVSLSAHNAFLLDDTIAENILIGRDGDVCSAIKCVCFEKDLESMPQKYNTVVGDNGVRLSQGQQARISLARALIAKNKIVLLDDPFSAVDEPTERAIIENLKQFHRDKIFIIASHRPTILKYADAVIEIKSSQRAAILPCNSKNDAQDATIEAENA